VHRIWGNVQADCLAARHDRFSRELNGSGTVADLFRAEDRGMPMNALALMVCIGQVCVPCEHKRVNLCDHLKLLEVSSSDWWGFMGYTMELWRMFAIPTSETRLRSFQVLGIFAAFSCLLNALFLRATRGYVILSWRANQGDGTKACQRGRAAEEGGFRSHVRSPSFFLSVRLPPSEVRRF